MNEPFPEREPQAYPSFFQSLGLIGFLILISVLLSPVTLLFGDSPLGRSFALLVSYVGAFGLALFIGMKRKQQYEQRTQVFSFARVSWPLYLVLFLITLALIMPIDFLSSLIPMPEYFREMFREVIRNDVFSILAVVVAAPLLEELLFRGVILDGFLKIYTPKSAIVLSAILFGLAHMNPWQFIGAFILGILIGWVYWKTDSLWPCIFIHLVNNGVASILTFWIGIEVENTDDLFADDTIYYSTIAGSVVIVFIAGLVLQQLLDRRKPE
jgi:uncharacterized protein